MNLPDLSFKHTWDIEADLPWESLVKENDRRVTAPKELDAKLFDAISSKAIPSAKSGDERYKLATVAFLYLYMSLTVDGYRCVSTDRLLMLQELMRVFK